MRPLLLLLAGCVAAPGPDAARLDQLEARVADLETQSVDLQVRAVQAEAQARAALSAGGAPDQTDPLTLRGLELRIQDLERRLVSDPAPTTAAVPETVGLPRVDVDPETGALVPRLDEDASVSCAARLIDAVRTAELAYDAAFDEFSEDLGRIGFTPDPGDGCAAYVAVAAEVDSGGFTVIAVITRGDGRGRQFHGAPHQGPREAARLDETGIATFLAGHAWAGSAR